MKPKFLSESEFLRIETEIPEEAILINFRLVGIGSNTIKSCQGQSKQIKDMVSNIPGYFLIATNTEDAKITMYGFIEKMMENIDAKKE